MGLIRDDFGRISVEERRESFIIHADYGYRPARAQLRNVEPGECYRDHEDAEPMQVVGRMIGCVLVKPAVRAVDGEGERKPLDWHCIPVGDGPQYEPLDVEDDDHPLGPHWKAIPHPEFELKDLDDLIAALIDLRDNR